MQNRFLSQHSGGQWGGNHEEIRSRTIAVRAWGGLSGAISLAGPAEDVQAAMQVLKSKVAALGTPGIKGEEAVAGKTVPNFGESKMKQQFRLGRRGSKGKRRNRDHFCEERQRFRTGGD